MTCSTPSAPCNCAPGATCCQRCRKRTKSAVVTGSISRRRRPMVRRWMRASRRRWHHSGSSAGTPGGERPPPLWPSASRCSRAEAASQDLAFGFKLRQRGVDQRGRHRQACGKLGSAIRSAGFEPAAQYFGGAGFFGFGTIAAEVDRRRKGSVWVDSARDGGAFGGRPKDRSLTVAAQYAQCRGAARLHQRREERLPFGHGRNGDQRQQGLVQL